MRLYFGRRRIADIDAALRLYPDKEFRSPTRSTVPLLSLLKHDRKLFERIVYELAGESNEVAAHLEFQVPPPSGNGTASHTDVLLLTSLNAIAIEAKWGEPTYETVDEWLGPTENRLNVLNGWLSLIQPYTSKPLACEVVASAVYQSIHRAASACQGDRVPKLVYLQFTPLPHPRAHAPTIKADLEHLHAAIGSPEKLSFWMIEVSLREEESFKSLKRLPKGQPTTAEEVIAALQNGPLFSFSGYKVHRIGASVRNQSTS